MNTREVRKNLCKLTALDKATCVHKYGKLKAVIVPLLQEPEKLAGKPAAARRWRDEQAHAALSDALKGRTR